MLRVMLSFSNIIHMPRLRDILKGLRNPFNQKDDVIGSTIGCFNHFQHYAKHLLTCCQKLVSKLDESNNLKNSVTHLHKYSIQSAAFSFSRLLISKKSLLFERLNLNLLKSQKFPKNHSSGKLSQWENSDE